MRSTATMVLDVAVDACSQSEVVSQIETWAQARKSRYICIANVHVVTTGWRDRSYGKVLNGADLVTPDGWPVAWALRRLGHRGQQRVDGPNLMLKWCEHAAQTGSPIYLYGSTDNTLQRLRDSLRLKYPGLEIAGAYSPPFRPLTDDERSQVTERINESGAGVVFVGLGAPKQELWMSEMRGDIRAVMIGVGAAFDFHAGVIARSPEWMQRSGLEWLHRLASEPRRLWRRYLIGNTLFVVGFGMQLVRTWGRKISVRRRPYGPSV